jgi:hypothetical protein
MLLTLHRAAADCSNTLKVPDIGKPENTLLTQLYKQVQASAATVFA